MADEKPQHIEEVFRHDLLNFVGAAKMNAEMAARNKGLPPSVTKNLERILSNLLKIEAMARGPSPAVQTETLAAAPESADEGANAEPTADSTSHPDHRLRRPKSLLLIDDSADLRSMFKAVFQPRGYHVIVAKDENEALAILQTSLPPDLILIDYMLGDRTGSDVLDTLERAGVAALKISKLILFTGLDKPLTDRRFHGIEQKATDLKSLIRLIEKYC